MKLFTLLLIAPAIMWAADDPYAAQLFQKHCASCHDSAAGADGRVPHCGRARERRTCLWISP